MSSPLTLSTPCLFKVQYRIMPFWAAQVQIMDMPAGIVITLPTTVARVHAHQTSRGCQVVVTLEALHGAES